MRRLDGLPLAIELTARIPSRSPRQIADALPTLNLDPNQVQSLYARPPR